MKKLKEHSNSFQLVSKNLQNINDSYFLAISKLVEEERKKMGAILKQEAVKYEEKLYEHRNLVKEKFKEFQNKKNVSV